jgi:hypothetical protein
MFFLCQERLKMLNNGDMIFNQKIAKKTISIKYSLITSAKPIRRSFSDHKEPKDTFPLYFEVLHNKKINRRSSLFYKFAKHLKFSNLGDFQDHYINRDLFNGLKDDKEELNKGPLSDLVLLEKTHIYFLVKMIENWDEYSYSFKNFAEIYKLSTVFAFDIIDEYFLKNTFLPILEKYINPSPDLSFPFLSYYKKNISSLEFLEVVNCFLGYSKSEISDQFKLDCAPYISLLLEFKELLTAEIRNTSVTTGNFRHAENLSTLPLWFYGSIKQKLTSCFENHHLKREALNIIEFLDERFVASRKEIFSLFKNPRANISD